MNLYFPTTDRTVDSAEQNLEALLRAPLVSDMVATVAATAPDFVALSAGGTRLTYGQLLAAADRWAMELALLGVGPDVPVAICLERSFAQIEAALGVLRAGGAYLPLDPAWPAERIRSVLEDARVPVVIAAAERTDELSGRWVVLPPAPGPIPSAPAAGSAAQHPRATVGPDNLAYVIYTSGSTGTPKGVEITHGNLLSLVAWHRDAFQVVARDRASHVAGLGFDAAVWEIWPYLTCGASIALANDSIRTSPEQLRRWLVDERISIAFVPTPLAEPLITSSWPPDTALRILLTGGDTLHVWPDAGLPFAVVNNYGPTECTVVATSATVGPRHAADKVPTIGRPIAGTQVHILDTRLRPVPTGEIGEIFIGGRGVGRGYRHQPALTAEKFIPDPFRRGDPGARLYRTGDLGCRLANGQIAFHGRADDQLKLRGYRIEPDEISAVLNRHPAIAQSFVTARPNGRDKQLVAYVVMAGQASPTTPELRDFLALTLPDYMIPAVFVQLRCLPLTTSGKVDRTALPAPTAANTLAGTPYRAPETAVEQRLAGILAELLAVERVGADDNFFLLGGHSLLGTQLVMRARETFSVDLALRDLFETQTVTKLSALIEQRLVESVAAMSDDEAQRSLTS